MSQQGFFVYVVESPSALDHYQHRSEADLLRLAIQLDQTPCVTRCAINRDAFKAALASGLTDAMSALPNRTPILHLSAHGNMEGIELSNGDIILWDELRGLLQPINEALEGFLLVCMSSCEGYAGIRMAMSTTEESLPFFGLVGCSDKPIWSDMAVAYAAFYHLLAKESNISDCVSAMKVASGVNDIYWSPGNYVKESYAAYVQNQNALKLESILNTLRINQQQPPFDQMAKPWSLEEPATGE